MPDDDATRRRLRRRWLASGGGACSRKSPRRPRTWCSLVRASQRTHSPFGLRVHRRVTQRVGGMFALAPSLWAA
jgi:hypothetical protein